MFNITSVEAAAGTSLQGYLLATFDNILAILGPPGTSQPDVPACWTLAFDDGTIATLYCYKTRHAPNDFFPWHIGGVSARAVARIAEALDSELLGCADFLQFWYEYRRLSLTRKPDTTYAWKDLALADRTSDNVQFTF